MSRRARNRLDKRQPMYFDGASPELERALATLAGLPVLLQRALTGSRGPERHAAERQVDAWIKERKPLPPSRPPVRSFTETEDQDHEH